MTTGFFKRVHAQEMSTPPESIPVPTKETQRTRFTTEQYWNGLSTPTTEISLGSVGIKPQAIGMPWGMKRSAILVTETVDEPGATIKRVSHVVIDGVRQ